MGSRIVEENDSSPTNVVGYGFLSGWGFRVCERVCGGASSGSSADSVVAIGNCPNSRKFSGNEKWFGVEKLLLLEEIVALAHIFFRLWVSGWVGIHVV